MQTVLANVEPIAARFARERSERQRRRELGRADFDALREAGFLLTGVPVEYGGVWQGVGRSTRPICEILRTLAHGDSSVALVSSMHPSVLSFWMASRNAPAPFQEPWEVQRRLVFQSACDGHWWGTITSEPGTGGEIGLTKASAERGPSDSVYLVSGQKHFGSGSGITSFMLTSAAPAGESAPDWFFFDMRGVPWDGSKGVRLQAAWDGHGMTATQSHAMMFERFPATRFAWTGQFRQIIEAHRGSVGCMFTAVITGVVEVALETARQQLSQKKASMRAYERVEWTRAELEGWLIQQAYEGMLRAMEEDRASALRARQAKTVVAELAESVLQRICRVIGGGAFSRHSPFGYWYEDVRALGFLRPPWALAYDNLFEAGWT